MPFYPANSQAFNGQNQRRTKKSGFGYHETLRNVRPHRRNKHRRVSQNRRLSNPGFKISSLIAIMLGRLQINVDNYI